MRPFQENGLTGIMAELCSACMNIYKPTFFALLLGLTVPSQAQSDLNQITRNGLIALESGQLERGLDLLRQANSIAPKGAESHLYVAIAYYKNKRYEDAYNHMKVSAELDKSLIDSAFYLYLASSLKGMGLKEHEERAWQDLQSWDKGSLYSKRAAKELKAIRDKAYRPKNECLQRGMQLWYSHPYTAMAYLESAGLSESGITDPRIYYMAALNHASLFDQVIEDHRKHFANNYLPASYRVQLAHAYMGKKEWENAATTLAPILDDAAAGQTALKCSVVCLNNLKRHARASELAKRIDTSSVSDQKFKRIYEAVEADNRRWQKLGKNP